MYFHWQNLSKEDHNKRFPIHGRCWFRTKKWIDVAFEWVLWGKSCGISINFDSHEGNDITFNIAFPPTSFYFTVNKPFANSIVKWIKGDSYEGRESHIRIHDWAIWWRIFEPSMSWSSSTPKWRDGSFHPLDFLFGKHNFTKKKIEEFNVQIPMIEKSYDAKVTFYNCEWKRPRALWGTKAKMADVEITDERKCIPYEGKGENSWDCGDDGLFLLWTKANNVADAISQTVESVLKTRLKRSGIFGLEWTKDKANA